MRQLRREYGTGTLRRTNFQQGAGIHGQIVPQSVQHGGYVLRRRVADEVRPGSVLGRRGGMGFWRRGRRRRRTGGWSASDRERRSPGGRRRGGPVEEVGRQDDGRPRALSLHQVGDEERHTVGTRALPSRSRHDHGGRVRRVLERGTSHRTRRTARYLHDAAGPAGILREFRGAVRAVGRHFNGNARCPRGGGSPAAHLLPSPVDVQGRR
mmetsp:Transcript_7833/g.19417  ORF Transcript_7833/g.19417 Transcript_7833/m.19417 type:complete len:210 (-) Transcript_7833:1001-1630(-)